MNAYICDAEFVNCYHSCTAADIQFLECFMVLL